MFFPAESAEGSDRILEGYLYRMGGPFLPGWQKRYFLLYPNRIEWRGEQVGFSPRCHCVEFNGFIILRFSTCNTVPCNTSATPIGTGHKVTARVGWR
jgi:hypothetical protein